MVLSMTLATLPLRSLPVRGGRASTAGRTARAAAAPLASPALPALSPSSRAHPARQRPRTPVRAAAEDGEGASSSTTPSVATQGVPGLEAKPATAAATAIPTTLTRPSDGDEEDRSAVQKFLYPDAADLPDDFAMPIWDHLDELRERVLVAAGAATLAVGLCFAGARDLVVFLEAPVAAQGVRFLQLSPGEFFFTTLKVAGYAGLLLATPTILYEVVAYVVPGLTTSERRLLAPIVFGSGALFYAGLLFSYSVLTPAALSFFVAYADGAVESLWSIDQYFSFVLVLMASTGLAFQVPVVQILLGQAGLVSSDAMFSQWRWVVVGATVAAAVLTPSTDPFTQTLLAVPLVGLYLGGAAAVRALEGGRRREA